MKVSLKHKRKTQTSMPKKYTSTCTQITQVQAAKHISNNTGKKTCRDSTLCTCRTTYDTVKMKSTRVVIIPGQSVIPESINQAPRFQCSYASTQTRLTTIHHFLPSNEQWTETKALLMSDENIERINVLLYKT